MDKDEMLALMAATIFAACGPGRNAAEAAKESVRYAELIWLATLNRNELRRVNG